MIATFLALVQDLCNHFYRTFDLISGQTRFYQRDESNLFLENQIDSDFSDYYSMAENFNYVINVDHDLNKINNADSEKNKDI